MFAKQTFLRRQKRLPYGHNLNSTVGANCVRPFSLRQIVCRREHQGAPLPCMMKTVYPTTAVRFYFFVCRDRRPRLSVTLSLTKSIVVGQSGTPVPTMYGKCRLFHRSGKIKTNLLFKKVWKRVRGEPFKERFPSLIYEFNLRDRIERIFYEGVIVLTCVKDVLCLYKYKLEFRC